VEEDMMNLDHRQQERLSKVLMEAFPSYDRLERMVFYELGAHLEAIASSKNMENCVFELIKHMRSHSKLDELVIGACKQNSSNEQLRAFAKEHHVITSDLTLSLPKLELSVFGTAPTTGERPKNELFNSEQVKLRMQPSDYYREEMLLGPADARRFGIPAGGQFALLQLQQFTLNERHHAVRLVIDPRLEQGVMACNQHFMAELRLDDSQPPQWSVLSAQRIVPLQECVLELAVERGNLEYDLETLQRRRDQILLNRALFFGQGQSIQSLSLRADGWGYFNLRSISPDLSQIAPDSILTFDERTNFQLFASHSKSSVDMVIVVDGSGSMDTADYLGANNSHLTRLKGVRLAVDALIQRRLLAGTRVSRLAFVVFGQNATMLYPSPQETMIEIKNEKQIKEIRDYLARKLTRLGLEDLKIDRGYSEIPRALSYGADLLD
jgi:Effector-associated domain 1